MYLFISEGDDEYAKVKLTLGRTLKHVSDRRELLETLSRDPQALNNVVILGSTVDISSALALSEELRLTHPTVGVLLLRKKVESQLISQAMAAGVREVLALNDPEAIVLACKRSEDISRRQSLNVGNHKAAPKIGRIIAVHGARDGLGSTSIAINIAIALSNLQESKVCLVDSVPTYGDVGVRLRIESTKSWADLMDLILVDDEALLSTMLSLKTGAQVLLSPREPNSRIFDGNIFVNQVLRPLQDRFSHIILDTDSRTDAFTREVLRVSDSVILTSDLDLASLKNLKLKIKELLALGLNSEQFHLVVNKADLKFGVNLKDFAELIGLPYTISLPWDNDVTRLSNEGKSMSAEKSRSLYAHSINELANLLFEAPSSTQTKLKTRSRRSA
jgi:pilus assembly protein CpaE